MQQFLFGARRDCLNAVTYQLLGVVLSPPSPDGAILPMKVEFPPTVRLLLETDIAPAETEGRQGEKLHFV